jgi:hypothetical protein
MHLLHYVLCLQAFIELYIPYLCQRGEMLLFVDAITPRGVVPSRLHVLRQDTKKATWTAGIRCHIIIKDV